jgi:hypothetical protein
MRNRLPPALVLYLLAPLIGVLLPGTLPPARFLNPLTLAYLIALYGTGALLCRELTVRWRRSWPTLLVLGLAFGVVVDGLATKSFFDPAWPDLGPLATYGRWLDVNWVWSVQTTLFHAVFSIGIPVLFVNLLYPRLRAYPLILERTFNQLVLVLAATVLLAFLFVSPYRPPLTHYLLTVVLVAALIGVAAVLPNTIRARTVPYIASTVRFGLLGFCAMLAFFALRLLTPYTPIPPSMTILCTEALALLVVWTTLRLANPIIGGWSDLQLLSLASGALSFLIILAPLQEWFPQGRDTRGMLVVALAATALLIWLVWHVRARNAMR